MNVLERIIELQSERGWSVYKLAYESGLTQSTISNMFYRKTLPSLTTLNQICNAFGITMAEFFSKDETQFSSEDFLFISNFRKLSKHDKEIISELISILLKK